MNNTHHFVAIVQAEGSNELILNLTQVVSIERFSPTPRKHQLIIVTAGCVSGEETVISYKKKKDLDAEYERLVFIVNANRD